MGTQVIRIGHGAERMVFENGSRYALGSLLYAILLVGRAGLEPATLCLKGRYSTDWVNGPPKNHNYLMTYFDFVNHKKDNCPIIIAKIPAPLE